MNELLSYSNLSKEIVNIIESFDTNEEQISELSRIILSFDETLDLLLDTLWDSDKSNQIKVLTDYLNGISDECKSKAIEVFLFQETLSENARNRIGDIFSTSIGYKDGSLKNFTDEQFTKKLFELIDNENLYLKDVIIYILKVILIEITYNG